MVGQIRIMLAMLQLLGIMSDQVRMEAHKNTDSLEIVPDFQVVAATAQEMALKIIGALATVSRMLTASKMVTPNRMDTASRMDTVNRMDTASRMAMQANKMLTVSKVGMVSKMGTASRMVMLNRMDALDNAHMGIKVLEAIRARDSTTDPKITILPKDQHPVHIRECILYLHLS